jgi:hypothetical protein
MCRVLWYIQAEDSEELGDEPANLGSNGKHANHYTTEATSGEITASIISAMAKFSITQPHFMFV